MGFTEDGLKTAHKSPTQTEEGPEKGRQRGQDWPEVAQAGLGTAQAQALPRWGAAPSEFHPIRARIWDDLGSVLGPKLDLKSFKIDPGARRKMASTFAC